MLPLALCMFKYCSQWTIYKYKQGNMSLDSPRTSPCSGVRWYHTANTWCRHYELTPIYTKTLTHRPSLVYLAAHPSWEALWSHIKQITTWETTRMHEFTHKCRETLSHIRVWGFVWSTGRSWESARKGVRADEERDGRADGFRMWGWTERKRESSSHTSCWLLLLILFGLVGYSFNTENNVNVRCGVWGVLFMQHAWEKKLQQ